MASEKIKITINNWEKYNPRAVVKYTQWFRMNNSMWMSQDMHTLTHAEKWVWVCLMSIASQKQSAEIEIDPEWFQHYTDIDETTFKCAIAKLTRNGQVTCTLRARNTRVTRTSRARYAHVTSVLRARNDTEQDITLRTGQDTTEQDRTNETNKEGESAQSASPPDLLLLWNLNCEALPNAEALSAKRERLWKTRWGEKPDLEYWGEVIKRLAASPFCNGQNERGWKASIDFLLQPDTRLKALEGKYDSGPRFRNKTRAELVSEANAELYRKVEQGEA